MFLVIRCNYNSAKYIKFELICSFFIFLQRYLVTFPYNCLIHALINSICVVDNFEREAVIPFSISSYYLAVRNISRIVKYKLFHFVKPPSDTLLDIFGCLVLSYRIKLKSNKKEEKLPGRRRLWLWRCGKSETSHGYTIEQLENEHSIVNILHRWLTYA